MPLRKVVGALWPVMTSNLIESQPPLIYCQGTMSGQIQGEGQVRVTENDSVSCRINDFKALPGQRYKAFVESC